jgi:energy-coupling factor transporter transmembrane protein EcfT
MGASGMLKRDFLQRSFQPGLVEVSPLRRVDPRVKLLMALCASLTVMLPLAQLAIFVGVYALFLAWARLLPLAARQTWRLRWLLLLLFILDTWLVSWELAFAVSLRLALLAGVFSLLVATTTPRELSLALEGLRLPYRYAFSLGLAFQSLSLLEEEWRAIQEAQISRGITFSTKDWRQTLRQVRSLTALTVPAIVLTTRRAWSITEAAYARGFDSPLRRPYRRLVMSSSDWLYLSGALIITAIFMCAWQLIG